MGKDMDIQRNVLRMPDITEYFDGFICTFTCQFVSKKYRKDLTDQVILSQTVFLMTPWMRQHFLDSEYGNKVYCLNWECCLVDVIETRVEYCK